MWVYGGIRMNNAKLFEKHVQFILNKHYGQTDKQGDPYILHLMRVAAPYLHNQSDFLIALGHDLLEDTDVTYQEIVEEDFSQYVIQGIRILTHRLGESYEKYIARILHSDNKRVIAIKRTDIMDNMGRLDTLTNDSVRLRLQAKYEMALTMIDDWASHV